MSTTHRGDRLMHFSLAVKHQGKTAVWEVLVPETPEWMRVVAGACSTGEPVRVNGYIVPGLVGKLQFWANHISEVGAFSTQ